MKQIIIWPEIIYPCLFCGTDFPNKKSLIRHIRHKCEDINPEEIKKAKFKFLKPR